MKFRVSIVVLACRLATIAALAVATPTFACLNTFESRILGYLKTGEDEQLKTLIAGLEADFQKDPSLKHSNDLAVARVLTHRVDEAIALLEEAEQRFPGKAIVAANLGTAFELAGKDAEALRWIREGVRRDSKEHFGSEWLHVRILETKLALAGDTKWLETHTVLGVEFGAEVSPHATGPMPVDETGAPRALRNVSNSLLYQLNERTKFVKPPDPVVADLYAAQGDILFSQFERKDSDGFATWIGDPAAPYQSALKYGSARAQLVQRRLDAVNKIYADGARAAEIAREQHDTVVRLWLLAAGMFIIVGGAWYARRRSRIRRP